MNRIFIIFIILNYFIYINNGQSTIGSLITSEYNCINSLITKIGQTSQFSTIPSSTDIDYCSKTSIISCSNGYVSSVSVSQLSSNTNLIISSDLSCFSKIVSLTLSNSNVSPNVLYSSLAATLTIFTLSSPKVTTFEITQLININCKSLYISFSSTTTLVPIKLSYLKSGAQFISISKSGDELQFNNDLTSSTSFSSSLEFTVANIPNLSNALINDLVINLGNAFDVSTYSLLSTFTGIKKLKISSGAYLAYPNELHSMTNSVLEDLTLSILFNPVVASFPNYSVFSKLISLTVENSSTFILSNTSTNYPTSLLNLNFNNIGIKKLEDYSTFNNIRNINLKSNSIIGQLPSTFSSNTIRYLDLSNNLQMTGTDIGEGYCNTILKLTGNSLISGTLPECYRGHLYDSTIESWFTGTQLSTTPLDSLEIIPNMKIENGKTFLYGKNVGFLASSIKTSPSITFDLDIPNQRFYSNSTTVAIYTVTFTSANDKVFYLSNSPSYPTPSNIVSSSDGTFTIKGSYFSYNQSSISVTIDGSPCVISQATTFNQIVCKLSSFNSTKTNVQAIITVDKESSQFTLNSLLPGVDNVIEDCENGCSGHGQCNFETKVCTCDDGWTTEEDCSSAIIQCKDPLCSGNGNCSVNGICECDQLYTGDVCSTPSQFVSSIVAPGEVGGLTIFRGWFGNVHQDIKVLIGGKICTVTGISSKELNCTAPPGIGEKEVHITQNGFAYVNPSIFRYYSGYYRCLNDCTDDSNGICDSTSGICSCFDDWTGFDCGSKDNGGSKTSPDGISNNDVSYEISVYKIVEYSITGETIAEYGLKNSWVVDKDNNNIHSFTQSIGTTGATVTSTIEEIKTKEERTFGGVKFQVVPDSIKLSVNIKNYQYQSNLNYIQLQFKSHASSNDDCNNDPDVNESDGSALNYLTITKNDKKLYGRFLSTVISDGQPTYVSNKILNSPDRNEVIVGLNLPHFLDSCLIDPDFSVLVTPDSQKCNSKPWLLPVAIVIPVVAVSLIVLGAVLYYQKNRTFIQIKLKTLKDKY